MYLRTLTLRGFKSFASATTLHFEPGITCVVGPNGSGKSNVVDALAWVMGEQGAKTLRGGAMADVIFAGTSTRPALGRAEVALTIDNSDGALPIDYTEVTISRTLFSSGGSEYAINNTPCRLLDIQELLSDSGLGRTMHVIVGQGQLDAVLRATPEERRGFIEEAAGILKHRRRKEKALRKLEQVAGNLARLGDLVTEIRRQLGPLAKQAEVARRAAVVQADLRDARARLLADDLHAAQSAHEREVADAAVLTAAREEIEAELARARGTLAQVEAEAARLAPAVAEATEIWYRLSGLRERLRGTATLADERCRLLGTAAQEHTGPDPDDLEAQAERAREHERSVTGEVEAARGVMEEAVRARQQAEAEAGAHEKALAAVHRGVADRREGLARLAGQVSAVRTRLEAQAAEIERLEAVLTEARTRGQAAELEFAQLELQVADVQEGEEGLDAAHEEALTRRSEALDVVARLEQDLQTAAGRAQTAGARADALALSLERRDAAGALLNDGPGVLGRLTAALTVEPGWEDAIAAALGDLVDAPVVADHASAVGAIEWVREHDLGRAGIVVASGGAHPGTSPASSAETALPDGARWARDVVTASAELADAVVTLLDGVAVVADLATARAVIDAGEVALAVTAAGDVLGASYARGGVSQANAIALTAAHEEAVTERDAAQASADQARFALGPARQQVEEAETAVAATLAALHASDAAFTAVADQLGRLGAAARAAAGEVNRAERAIEQAAAGRAERAAELADLTTALEAAQADPADASADLEAATARRDATAEAARIARAAETDARLTLRTAEERQRAAAGRVASLERAARAEREARARAQEHERQRRRRAGAAQEVRAVASQALTLLDASLMRAAAERDVAQARRAELDAGLGQARSAVEHLSARASEITEAFHRDELARAEFRMRVEELQRRSMDELAIDPDELVAQFGPDVPVPVLEPGADPDTPPATVPYRRAEQEKRLRAAERALALLGRVNPLALEEHAALEERHTFLVEQLADVRKSRTDLLEIVREIDERVEQVFAAAWRDTEREFAGVFARLFPGGEGRLLLTEPEDMLTTGIEVEARPPGKKVKRLSLLSGGERSLTAIALLVAIFKARPSPFYVMDEVEAALDDVNLGRLLGIFTELRDSSQLIVITHQKRTMEIADALYGVTMRGDGVSTVIGQRLERESNQDDLADAG